jgi:hypothetical protein
MERQQNEIKGGRGKKKTRPQRNKNQNTKFKTVLEVSKNRIKK